MRREVKLGSPPGGTLVFGWELLAYVWWGWTSLLVCRVFQHPPLGCGASMGSLEMSLKSSACPCNGGMTSNGGFF